MGERQAAPPFSLFNLLFFPRKKKELLMNSKFLFVIMIAFIATTISTVNAQDQDTAIVHVGDPAPQFSFQPIGGEKTTINDLKGKVVLINLFATWCPPCKKEMPILQKNVFETIKDKNFAMFSFGREHKEAEIKEFAEKNKLTFPMVADPEKKIFNLFAKQSIPRTFIIGKDGKIIYALFGYEEEEFTKLIEFIKAELKK